MFWIAVVFTSRAGVWIGHSVAYDEELEEEAGIQWEEDNSLEAKGDGEGYYMSSACSCSCRMLLQNSTADLWRTASIGCQGFESDIDEDVVDNRDSERLNQSVEFVRRLEQVWAEGWIEE